MMARCVSLASAMRGGVSGPSERGSAPGPREAENRLRREVAAGIEKDGMNFAERAAAFHRLSDRNLAAGGENASARGIQRQECTARKGTAANRFGDAVVLDVADLAGFRLVLQDADADLVAARAVQRRIV